MRSSDFLQPDYWFLVHCYAGWREGSEKGVSKSGGNQAALMLGLLVFINPALD